MNIFLSSRFSRRHECHVLGKKLAKFGHKVVSRWTMQNCDHIIPAELSEQASDAERKRFAIEDYHDISDSEWFIVMTNEPRNNGRGGYHVEFGIALAMQKKLTIIGPRENIFHHWPRATHFINTNDFLSKLPYFSEM